jgi:SAM-dependent methyltransferase
MNFLQKLFAPEKEKADVTIQEEEIIQRESDKTEPKFAITDWEKPRDPEPGEPRLNWILSEPVSLPQSSGRAGEWNRAAVLSEISRCPSCHNPNSFNWSGGALSCRSCAASFNRSENDVVNFITAAAAQEANLKATDAVSRHTYDVAARQIIDHVRSIGGTVLDCGAGAHDRQWDNVVRIEIEPYDYTDIMAVNQELPFQDSSFDAVFSLNVLEHVNNPFLCAQEIIRVLKPGGIAYAVVPFLQPVHGYPDHYFNMTTSGVHALFRGIGTVETQFVPAAGQPIFTLEWFLRSYLAGLNGEAAGRFADMTVAEILQSSPVEHLDKDYVRTLKPEQRMELACTTGAFVRKHP